MVAYPPACPPLPTAGVVLPLLSQTVVFWQVLLARFMLRKQLGRTQLAGVLLVVVGVILAAWPSKGAGSVLANVSGWGGGGRGGGGGLGAAA